jgi:SAM-dependent methyltransferase
MDGYYSGLNKKLMQALPSARRVLELGCAEGRLGAAYKREFPQAEWVGVDIHPSSVEAAKTILDAAVCLDVERDPLDVLGEGYDLVVMGDVLEHLVNPLAALERIRSLCAPGARLVCCIPNMGHYSVVERLLGGDMSYDKEGLLDETHVRFFTLSSAFKMLLDGGWLPHLADFYEVVGKDEDIVQDFMRFSERLGVDTEIAASNLFVYQFVFSCTLRDDAVPAQAARVSVIVPVRDPRIVRLNILRSPGLLELDYELLPVEGPASAAEALASVAPRARGDWLFLASEDLYLPKGAGHAISAELAKIPENRRRQSLVGLAGVGLDGAGKASGSGFLMLPHSRENGPASLRALSMEDCGVFVARDSLHQIDPCMGWAHWATDMCLRALGSPELDPGRIVRLPVFHNRTRGLPFSPQEADNSIRHLLERYAGTDALRVLREALSKAA